MNSSNASSKRPALMSSAPRRPRAHARLEGGEYRDSRQRSFPSSVGIAATKSRIASVAVPWSPVRTAARTRSHGSRSESGAAMATHRAASSSDPYSVANQANIAASDGSTEETSANALHHAKRNSLVGHWSGRADRSPPASAHAVRTRRMSGSRAYPLNARGEPDAAFHAATFSDA